MIRSMARTLGALLCIIPSSAHSEWFFYGQESAFNVRGTYSIFNEDDDGYMFSVWCLPEGLYATFDTPEILEIADVPERSKSPVIMLFKSDDYDPRYYAGTFASEQRKLRIEVLFDPIAVRQMAEADFRIAIALQGPHGISHERSFDVDGISRSTSQFFSRCHFITS